MNRRSWLLALAAGALVATVATAGAGGGSSVDGGDTLRLQFEEARLTAGLAVLAVDQASYFAPEDVDLAPRFLQLRDSYEADLRNLVFVWDNDDDGPNCAETNISGMAPSIVRFYKKVCLRTEQDRGDQVKLMLHESAHHFDRSSDPVQEEHRADRIAIAVYNAWLRSIDASKPRWDYVTTDGAPDERGYHSLLDAGGGSAPRVIVWGGCHASDTLPGDCAVTLGDGAIYDMTAKTWQSLPGAGAPTARAKHSAVWDDGTQTGGAPGMIVWGGCSDLYTGCSQVLSDGARYDAGSGSWRPLAAAPRDLPGRTRQTTSWTGAGMLIWGGETRDENRTPRATGSGAIYAPATDSWTMLPSDKAPSARMNHTAVFTGATGDPTTANRVIIWGGCEEMRGWFCLRPHDDGAILDLATMTWETIPSGGAAPSARWRHAAVWTGTAMIVWGGQAGSDFLGDGAVYDLKSRSWHQLNSTGPAARAGHAAVWTGDRMIIWGGIDDNNTFNSINPAMVGVAAYEPGSDVWTTVDLTGFLPVPRENFASAWNGHELIVWGGDKAGDQFLNIGNVLTLNRR